MNELHAIERAIGLRGSLHDFVEMAWPIVEPGWDFVDNWHIHAVCEHLEAVTAGEIPRLVINIPPGSMKSLTTSVFWHPWTWLRDPGMRWIFASYSGSSNPMRDARKSLQIMRSQWFLDRWSDRFRIATTVAEGNFFNDRAGYRFSTTVAGEVTGNHCDIQVVDDPIKPQDVSGGNLKKVAEWWDTVMVNRFRDYRTARRVIIMQRLHCDDLAGRAIEDGYALLRLPMRYEKKLISITKLGQPDPRREEGELLWPARWPAEIVDHLEGEMKSSTTVSAQNQQSPTPSRGLIYQTEWFKHWICLPSAFDMTIQSWDFTFKDAKKSDFVVGQLWARATPDYYLIDQVRERADFPRSCDMMREFTKKWPRAIAKLVEDKANGPAVISTLKKEIPGILAVEPTGSKEARAASVAPLYRAGNVWHPQEDHAPWVKEHRLELTSFPFYRNDDTVDASSQALSHLHLQGSSFAAAMARVRAGLP